MMKKLQFYSRILKETFIEWNRSQASVNAASLAYYAIFSIPGLLIIIIWIAGNFFGEEAIRGEISRQISGVMGAQASKSIEEMIAGALIDRQNFIMKTVGVGSLICGATTLFFQLQRSLNELWEVEPAPRKAFLKFIIDRANSLGMILILGFLLMITMVLSSLVSLLNMYITKYFGLETYILVEGINFLIGFGVVLLLFALMFKVLPDVEIRWKSVWAGSFFTAVLFVFGKFLLNLYFGNFRPTSAFGGAGTVILIMMWINYSCMLVFFGAEFTRIYSIKKGYQILPSSHAKWISGKADENQS